MSQGSLISKWWDLVGTCECCGNRIVTQTNGIWQCWRCKIRTYDDLRNHESCRKCKMFRIVRNLKLVKTLLDRINELLIYNDSFKIRRFDQIAKKTNTNMYRKFGVDNPDCYWLLDYELIPLKRLFESIRQYYISDKYYYRWYDKTFLENLPEINQRQHNTISHLFMEYNPFIEITIENIRKLKDRLKQELKFNDERIQKITNTNGRLNIYGKPTTIWVGQYWITKFLNNQYPMDINQNLMLYYLNFIL